MTPIGEEINLSDPSLRDWTDEQVEKLIETLARDRPDLWEKYINDEKQLGIVDSDIGVWIMRTADQLYPNNNYLRLVYLLSRMRDVVHARLTL